VGAAEPFEAGRTAQRPAAVIRLPVPSRAQLAAEIREVREQAVTRVSEVDLLVAALRDHITDLQAERDWLRAELARANEARELAGATWLHRGQKANR
jgi:hypothetical protein